MSLEPPASSDSVELQWTDVSAQLLPGETLLAHVRTDLDADKRFAHGLVVLTNRRLLSFERQGPQGPMWRYWELGPSLNLRARDRAGLGTFEVWGPAGRLAQWNYTVGRAHEVHRLLMVFEAIRRGEQDELEALTDDGEPLVAPPPRQAARARSLLRLVRFTKPHTRLIVLGMLLTLATTVANLIPPYLTQPLTDNILAPYQSAIHDVEVQKNLTPAEKSRLLKETQARAWPESQWRTVTLYLSIFLLAATAAWLLGWAQGAVMAWVSERMSADLRNATYAHIQKLSLEFFGGKRTGDLMSRISTDTERICSFLSDNLIDFLTDTLMIIGTAAVLTMFDPVLGLATLIMFPIIAFLIFWVRDKLQHGFHRGGRAWGAMTSVLADTIPGIRVVKAFAQEQREIERFERANMLVVEANDRVNSVWTFFWPMVQYLNQLGLLMVWAVGAWRVYVMQLSVGVLIAFIGYITRLYLRLESMSRMFTMTQRAAASSQRIFDLLDRVPSVAEPENPVVIEQMRGEVELRDVGFRYGNRAILHGVTLNIKPGELVGLVGPSGAGKSTLVNLVCRFYDVTSGSILVDGVDVRSLALSDYRKHIGIVLQEPFLFYGTIAENIAYGRPEAARSEIVAAAKAARAHEFILRLADGYDSLVGERGQTLSGGERQRISIARALLIDPRILILDEATSSVDTETEREIQAALDNLVQGRTTIAIAHRLSTLRKADRLVVLERGKIAQIGTHHDLLAVDGVYARLHRAQQEAAEALAD